MNKTNVMHLISSLESGGAENLLVNLLSQPDSSAKINFTVAIINKYVDKNLQTKLLDTGWNVYFLNKKQGDINPKHLFQLLNIIKKHKIQIIHSHNYGSKMWAILCKILYPRLKLVHTVHNMTSFKELHKPQIFLHEKFIDMNIAISKAVLNECHKYGINKTAHIYNGINIKDFRVNENKPFKNESLFPFRIINVARINHNIKGQDILINALKICKDRGLNFSCMFAGGIYDYSKDSYEYLSTQVRKLGLEEEISFLGNREDVSSLLVESDLFVLPSRFEGLGLSILEAMAAGTPVIASDLDGPAEIVTHGENGFLFEPENYEDLAEKIILLKENFDLRNNLRANAFKYIKPFDISVMCQKYNKLYGSLLKEEVLNTNA